MAGGRGAAAGTGDAEAGDAAAAAAVGPRSAGWIPGSSPPGKNQGALPCGAPRCGGAHPLQIAFLLVALAALALLVAELARGDGTDAPRVIAALGFLLLALCLVWLGGSASTLRTRDRQLAGFQSVNASLQAQVDDLAKQNGRYKDSTAGFEQLNAQLRQQNQSYADKNSEHQRLNDEMGEINADMKAQNEALASEGEAYRRQNAEHRLQIDELTLRIGDLGRVEKQLDVLANECNGSVVQARSLLERLERDLRLNTVNTVFLFFDRIDKQKSGKLDNEEVSLFVDNLSFLWRHLPTFNKDKVKAKLLAQGGISLEQVHELVDGMMLEEDMNNPEALTQRLQRSFTGGDSLRAMLAEAGPQSQGDPNDLTQPTLNTLLANEPG